jgi:3-oxoacyl-[acyl-carrier-protein] synthase-3
MKKVEIKGTGSCIPDRIVPNSYFEKIVGTTDEWIIARTGIQTRRMIEPGQALTDLATPASKRALEMAEISPKELDIIIVGTSSADMLSPSAASIPTALDEAVRSGQIRRGDLILVNSFGAGFTWGAALLRY